MLDLDGVDAFLLCRTWELEHDGSDAFYFCVHVVRGWAGSVFYGVANVGDGTGARVGWSRHVSCSVLEDI